MGGFDFQQLISAFIVLFAVIDIFGAIPIILDLRQKGRDVNATKATLISFALLIGFFYAGAHGNSGPAALSGSGAAAGAVFHPLRPADRVHPGQGTAGDPGRAGGWDH